MKRKVATIIGRLAFIAGYPVIYAYMWPSRRTRVLIVCGKEVLVMKTWLNVNRWILPGGGLHRGEAAAVGAAREVQEETGIAVLPKDLRLLFDKKAEHYHGFRFAVTAFSLELSAKPKLSQQQLEVAELAWLPAQELLNDPKVSRDTHQALEVFYE